MFNRGNGVPAELRVGVEELPVGGENCLGNGVLKKHHVVVDGAAVGANGDFLGESARIQLEWRAFHAPTSASRTF